MALMVCKYGGSSVGSLARIQHIASQIIAKKQAGHQVVVVLSAMQGTTNELLQMAKQVTPDPDANSAASLLATGEVVSCALLSIALHAKGCRAKVFSGQDAGLLTDSCPLDATLKAVNPTQVQAALSDDWVPVVTGFQGVDAKGHLTTLGRGGSDLTAVALASALKANECLIYTDVPGVYTADPKLVPNAQLIQKASWEAMLALSQLGAKVLQAQAVAWAKRYQVPIRVLSSFFAGMGSWIGDASTLPQPLGVVGISVDAQASSVFQWQGEAGGFEAAGLSEVVLQGPHDGCYTLWAPKVYDRSIEALLSPIVASKQAVVRVSVVYGQSKEADDALIESLLAKKGISVYQVQSFDMGYSWVVPENHKILAIRLLHAHFGLDKVRCVERGELLTE